MSGTALVLAAHGSRIDPAANAHIQSLAENIRRRGLFDEVTPAFHHGSPGFAEALDRLDTEHVVVVPMMTSEGYFCDVVLPRELARNRRFAEVRVIQTPPLGLHPSVVDLLDRRVREWTEGPEMWDRLSSRSRSDNGDACLAIVGHGTQRHPQSRRATERICDALRGRGRYIQVLEAFLDEWPGVESVLSRAECRRVVVIPFLITGGPHATMDIPTRIGLPRNLEDEPPFFGVVGEHEVLVDRAVGLDPAIPDLILEVAFLHRAQRPAANRRRVAETVG